MPGRDAKGVGAQFLDSLQEHLATLMKTNGFKKSGRCYFRVHEKRRYDVIEFRGSIYGSAERSRFTCEVYQHDARKDDPHARQWKRFPTTGSNVFSRNIGDFMPGGRQHWWDLDGATDIQTLSNEIERLIKEQVIPYFGSWGPTKKPFIVPAW